MRLGAYDFVAKPWKNVELLEVVRKAVEKKALRRETVVLREVITRRDGLPDIVGESPEIREVLSMITRVAASDSPVLVHGESGTGKELVARAIHLRGKRAARPFVSVNCGALPDTLLETELFGHKKGLPLTASRWSVLRARTHRAWWRLRLTLSEVVSVIRRGGARDPLENHIWLVADEAPAPRRRTVGPARVLDFEARLVRMGGARRPPPSPPRVGPGVNFGPPRVP